ncbi:hypothetical protein, partial [Paenibacillus macerans]|uniref:hypothetical protein n=1 Tax=Paenibacillus macerans TaxID=44252 RepID=UPI003D272D70
APGPAPGQGHTRTAALSRRESTATNAGFYGMANCGASLCGRLCVYRKPYGRLGRLAAVKRRSTAPERVQERAPEQVQE